MKIRAGLTGLAVTAAAFLAVSTPVREASSTTAMAPAQDRATLITTQVLNEHQEYELQEYELQEYERQESAHQEPAAAGDSALLPIREAHSDGGYSYWRQEEIRLPIQAAVRTAPPKL